MKQRNSLLFFLSFVFLLCSSTARAQYWSVWLKTHNITLGLSSDEKWAFFIQKNDAGIANIYKVEIKTNTVTPVTNFTDRPVLSGIVLFGKPSIVFARAASTKGDDIHLYHVIVSSTDPPMDFTSKDGTSSKQILGMADNGRYIYYLSDKGPGTHIDTYRYDTRQYVVELAFANDRDYETLGWSHDQTQLLLHDPKSGSFYRYSIETTDKQQAESNDPMLTLYKANKNSNLSLNQKFVHIPDQGEKILDSMKTQLPLPSGAFDLVIGPKESSILYANMEGNATKLFLYDIGKKTSKELTVIK